MMLVKSFLMIFLIAVPLNAAAISGERAVRDELEHRLSMLHQRFVAGKTPVYTDDFILADISLNPDHRRWFTNFSGDEPGRYLTLLACSPPPHNPIERKAFLAKTISYQRADGRFGDSSIVFDSTNLGEPQMTLLWGNGRLLAGLMDYYDRFRAPSALAAAERLARFLSGIADNCLSRDAVERLKRGDAAGYICFTQIVEGMAKLYAVTRNPDYLHAAEKAYELLPEMGNQHTHGYLNTLRGVALLYEITKDRARLDFVIRRFDEILSSEDYLIFGGTSEYFGDQSLRPYYHDEGCSLGDFVMLCLQLWEITGEEQYLEKGEYCLMNQFFHNQFYSGDFGHHQIDTTHGFMLEPSEGRAWWCCNYHCATTLSYVKDRIITPVSDGLRVNLFFHASCRQGGLAVEWYKVPSGSGGRYALKIVEADAGRHTIAIRKPEWAATMHAFLGHTPIEGREQNGCLVYDRRWKRGEVLNIEAEYRVVFVRRSDRKELSVNELGDGEITAALKYGPYLMSIDDGFQPLYVASPSWGHTIIIDENMTQPALSQTGSGPAGTFVGEAYLRFRYRHWGMSPPQEVIMRPMSEDTYQRPANLRVWFRFVKSR